jgi:hypothetical protein
VTGADLVRCISLFDSPLRTGDAQPVLVPSARTIVRATRHRHTQDHKRLARASIWRQTCPCSNATIFSHRPMLQRRRTAAPVTTLVGPLVTSTPLTQAPKRRANNRRGGQARRSVAPPTTPLDRAGLSNTEFSGEAPCEARPRPLQLIVMPLALHESKSKRNATLCPFFSALSENASQLVRML